MTVSRFAAVIISVRTCTSQYDRLGGLGEMGSWWLMVQGSLGYPTENADWLPWAT
jgi:hypothetical protein